MVIFLEPEHSLNGTLFIKMDYNGPEETNPEVRILIRHLCFIKDKHRRLAFYPAFPIPKIGAIATKLFYLLERPCANPNDM